MISVSPRGVSGSIDVTTPTRKRRAPPEDDMTPSAKKRVTISTSSPVRQFLSGVVPSEGSPAVAVSLVAYFIGP